MSDWTTSSSPLTLGHRVAADSIVGVRTCDEVRERIDQPGIEAARCRPYLTFETRFLAAIGHGWYLAMHSAGMAYLAACSHDLVP